MLYIRKHAQTKKMVFQKFQSSIISSKFPISVFFVQKLMEYNKLVSESQNYQYDLLKSAPSPHAKKEVKQKSQNAASLYQSISKNASKRSQNILKKTPYFGSSSSEQNASDQSYNSNKNESIGQSRSIWTRREDSLLISLFKDFGANWTEISNRLQNKTSLKAKQRFYRLIRDIVENINNALHMSGERQIKLKAIKAAIEATDSSLDDSSIKDNYSFIIRDQISKLIYNYLADQELYNSCQEKSIDTISQILHIFKRNRKKKHSSKASTEIYMKEEIQYQQMERGYLSDSSSVFEEPKQSFSQHDFVRNRESLFADEEPLSQMHQNANGVIVEEQQQRIKDLLRESGILEVQQIFLASRDNEAIYQDSMPGSSSDNLNNQSYQHFFEQSQLEKGCYWKKNLREEMENTE